MNVKKEITLPATEEAKGWVRLGDDDMFDVENIPDVPEGAKRHNTAIGNKKS